MTHMTHCDVFWWCLEQFLLFLSLFKSLIWFKLECCLRRALQAQRLKEQEELKLKQQAIQTYLGMLDVSGCGFIHCDVWFLFTFFFRCRWCFWIFQGFLPSWLVELGCETSGVGKKPISFDVRTATKAGKLDMRHVCRRWPRDGKSKHGKWPSGRGRSRRVRHYGPEDEGLLWGTCWVPKSHWLLLCEQSCFRMIQNCWDFKVVKWPPSSHLICHVAECIKKCKNI